VSRTEVAVKKVSHESRQGMKEFVAEVVTIGQLRHRNLVQLLGYCRRKGELLLVYDYMPSGSLDKFLHSENSLVLSWNQRLRIITGVASSILYLHEDWEQVVLHRDIKASNVLLDAEMNARLGDFGLARLYDHGTDPHTTHVVGTMGYLAPEIGHTGRASKASDVFAFGVFVLEVSCGRRPVAQDEHGDHRLLLDWVLQHWRHGTITDAVDPRLHGDFAVEEANRVLKLSLLCSHPLPGARPGIRQIVQFLDGSMPLPELSETHLLSFDLQALMQNQALKSHSSSSAVAGNISDIPAPR
jgi:serine/threonine protein kinase